MDLENQRMTLSKVVWHTAGSNPTVELVLQSQEVPPRPAHVREDLWYGGGGETLSVIIPVPKKATTTPPTGIGLVGQDAQGADIYVRYTWDAKTQTWITGPRVDPGTGLPL